MELIPPSSFPLSMDEDNEVDSFSISESEKKARSMT